jgi:hypothetical protein
VCAEDPVGLSELVGLICAFASLAFTLGAFLIYRSATSGINVVGLQRTGSADAARKLIGCHLNEYRSALRLDLPLIVSYSLGLVIACTLGERVSWHFQLSGLTAVGYASTGTAAVFNITQDICLLVGIRTFQHDREFHFAARCSALKFIALGVAGAIALCADGTALFYLARQHIT